MPQPGFHERQADFQANPVGSFAGQVRRFGPHGPAYEVIGQASGGEVSIVVVASGERLTYSVTDLLADPLAETVP